MMGNEKGSKGCSYHAFNSTERDVQDFLIHLSSYVYGDRDGPAYHLINVLLIYHDLKCIVLNYSWQFFYNSLQRCGYTQQSLTVTNEAAELHSIMAHKRIF